MPVVHHARKLNVVLYFFPIALFAAAVAEHLTIQVMPDDHSELVPPLPIPNRTVKRFRADDSAATSVKVGYCQACYTQIPASSRRRGFLRFRIHQFRRLFRHRPKKSLPAVPNR